MKINNGNRNKVRFLSVIVVLACMVLSGLAVRGQKSGEFLLGDYRGVAIQDAREAYETSKTAEDLIYLLKVLCYQAKVENVQGLEPEIVGYGTELFDLAKMETIDLAELGETDDTLLELLQLLRDYGVS